MTDHDLSELLDRLASRTSVASPPTPEMLAAGSRARRRRTAWGVVGAAAAVAVVAGGVAAVSLGDDAPSRRGTPVASDTPYVPPAGTRLVGIGHLAVAVPEEWGTNEEHCRTPQRDTVIIDMAVWNACLPPYPENVESIWFDGGLPISEVEGLVDEEIAGLPSRRTPVKCHGPASGAPRVCSSTVYFPGEGIQLEFESSTGPAEVEEMLSWIVRVDELTAVPGVQSFDMDHQDDDAAEHYRQALLEAGFTVETVTEKRPGLKPGYVLDVAPFPGTMLEPGSVVTVTEVAEPEGPVDEVSVGLNSVGPGDSMDYRGLEDAQIRAGGRVVVQLGGSVWIYPMTERPNGRIAGEASGDALALDPRTDGPNVGRTWNAVQPGTATLTVVLHADGRRYVIGTVTVVVR